MNTHNKDKSKNTTDEARYAETVNEELRCAVKAAYARYLSDAAYIEAEIDTVTDETTDAAIEAAIEADNADRRASLAVGETWALAKEMGDAVPRRDSTAPQK
jgi:hypothetical protein